MGYINVNVKLANSGDVELAQRGLMPVTDVRQCDVPVVVDTGAINLCLTEEVAGRLGLRVLRMQEARLANDSMLTVKIVGPVEVEYGDRSTTVRAMVLPGATENLLGVIPMEDMDLVAVPSEQRLVPNDPKHTLRKVLSPHH